MSFDQAFIHLGAPTLCGIKPGNLFSINKEMLYHKGKLFSKFQSDFSKEGIKVALLNGSNNKILFFVYNENLIKKLILEEDTRNYLQSKGYKSFDKTEKILSEILKKICEKQDFPHEIGIFLGYPLNDVIQYEKNKGSNCKYTGCWKSYSNVEYAIKAKELFRNCSTKCLQWYNQGSSISELKQKFSNLVVNQNA